MSDNNDSRNAGCGLGFFVAAFLSYAINGSFLWACLCGLGSWIYVAYIFIFHFGLVKEIFK